MSALGRERTYSTPALMCLTNQVSATLYDDVEELASAVANAPCVEPEATLDERTRERYAMEMHECDGPLTCFRSHDSAPLVWRRDCQPNFTYRPNWHSVI